MRLLHLTDDGKLSLTKDLIKDLPPYAILSHTWGNEDEEVTFQDLRDRPSEASTKVGFRKIMFCTEQAARDNLRYIWVDTCCIDKSNNTELSEAINSMFRWYRDAKRCYVYLADVSVNGQSNQIIQTHMSLWEPSFRQSRWFTRGWTLQELIAPPAVDFFSMEGTRLGDKKSLELQVHEITRIAIQALRGCSLSEFSVADRMAWADTRTNTRQEDKAYSLLGIFDVSMPLIYGEGEEKAFHRLREVISALETELDLPFAVEAPFNAYQRQHEPTCFENTRVDLLRDIYDWADGPDGACIFWLNGQAGTGKSTIARTVARRYDEKRRLGASFFFVKGGGDIGRADKFVTTIAAQLARRVPALNRHICEAAAERSDIASQSRLDQWRHLIIRPLSRLNLDPGNFESSYVLVIDALDECDNENNIRIIPQLLAEARSLKQDRLRIFLTSRPEVPIRSGFSRVPDPEHQDFVLHSILPQKVDHDIQVFWEHELSLIGQELSLGPAWPPGDAIRCLVQRAAGLFIWAATASRFIRQGRRFAIKRLETIVSSGGSSIIVPEKHLDEIYITVLKQSVVEEYTEKEKEELYCMLRQILGSIVLLYSPLSVQPLSRLLSIESRDISQALGDLHSVLDIPRDHTQMLRIHHPSFRDFLLDNDRCTDSNFLVNDKQAHQALTYHCIRLMSASLKQDICTIGKPGVLLTEVKNRHIRSNLPPDVQYACLYWTRHLQNSCMQLSDNDQVHRFLQEHLLHWLEALAWIGRTPEGVHMISSLESLTTGRNCLQLGDFVSDAKRFILYSRAVIEQAPLQTYCSALVFAPLMSIVRKHFQGCVPRWIRNRPTVPVNWKALVQTIECGRSHINNVAFSDELLASGTGDGNIMLWDISSGALLQTIEGHIRNCTGVAFLDGVLVSVSQDKTIKLWNPTSETLLKAFEIDLDDHSRVAFSKGLLASASSNYPVKVWDINSGVLLRTLEGQSNSDSCLAFSLNGYLARSYQNSIKIWNASSGSLLSMLNCGKNVGEVAISQDGKLLGSAAKEYLFDCTINVWDTSSGVMLRILNGHPYLISALAFSPDSSLLASVSIWGSLKLWESSSGAELLSEEGGERVFDLAFSLDGKLFASVERFSIQLWNANLGAVRGLQAPTLKSHSASITTAAFSPDGRLLASGSVSGAIKLWDTSSGEVLGTFETILVNSLAISPDGRLLASGSAITIKLWNISSGEVLGTFEETSSVNALAFSPDGKLLASGSDKSVKLWDLTSNSDPRTLGVHPWQITQVIFSPDGKLIASGDGFYFKLWDVSSGRVLWTLQPSYHAHGKISFSDDDSILQIDGRSFCVMSGEDSGMNPAKSVTIDREWVVWGKERVLWLPPEYRSHMVEVYRDNIAIYLRSGLAVFIKFAFED